MSSLVLRRLLTCAALLLVASVPGEGKRLDVPHPHAESKLEREVRPRGWARARTRMLSPLALFVLRAIAAHGADLEDFRPLSHDIDHSFVRLDGNGDGAVSWEEYMAGAKQAILAGGVEDEAAVAEMLAIDERKFDEGDLNADGSLSEREAEYMGYLQRMADNHDEHPTGLWPTETEILEEFDLNGDGKVTPEEFVSVVSEGLEDELQPGWADYILSILKEGDANGDGSLSVPELAFVQFLIRRKLLVAEVFEEELLDLIFRDWDGNADGKIDEEEIEEVCKANGVTDDPDAPTAWELAKEHFSDFDENRDGSWDKEEAKRLAALILQHSHDEF